jgi:hypothetical protein
MIRYVLEGEEYQFSYNEFKKYYIDYSTMSDERFVEQLTHALHLASIICFFKETSCNETLGDSGIIHRLTHLLIIKEQWGEERSILTEESTLQHLREIREQFKIVCELK